MRIWVVAPPGECLLVKADMVLFTGNTVSSVSELSEVRLCLLVALYKLSSLTVPL